MTETFEGCILAARTELKLAHQLIKDEITNYPVPISGCDAQFNHLLAERKKVQSAINALDTIVFVPTPRMLTPNTSVESR